MMKILAVRQPWASLLVLGIKPVENRSKGTDYRGDVAILAAQKIDPGQRALDAWETWRFQLSAACSKPAFQIDDLPRGILGYVDLHGVVNAMPDNWWFTGPAGLLMRRVRVLSSPIPWRGQQMMVNCPEALERQIRNA